MPSRDPRRIMIVGVGPHATRFYLPALAATRPEFGVSVVAAVELEGQGERTRAALAVAAADPDPRLSRLAGEALALFPA